ncbi:MAG: cysteine synthase A [Oscillospiraceae bacterium]|nr:cysteine synthase A [Oscillospiraceae bacterium]
MKVYTNLSEIVGKTPLLALKRFEQRKNLGASILAKLEYFNPARSVKDRVALAMILNAEEKNLLHEDSVIIEPTSGNTGIGLAAFAAARGYRVILTMPDTMSAERRTLLKAYGAEIVLTEGGKGMRGAIAKAREIAAATPHSFIPGQFTNEANPLAHYMTTGPEIWKDTNGRVDIFVAGVGTGGTLSGVGRYLKEQNPDIKVVAVEPKDSPLLSEGRAGSHKLQGIGAGFIPFTLDMKSFNEVIAVTTEQAYEAARTVARCEGVLPGISSGAALYAAEILAKRTENRRKNIVVLLPDNGEKYISTSLFDDGNR